MPIPNITVQDIPEEMQNTRRPACLNGEGDNHSNHANPQHHSSRHCRSNAKYPHPAWLNGEGDNHSDHHHHSSRHFSGSSAELSVLTV